MLQYAREREIIEKSPGDSKLGDLYMPAPISNPTSVSPLP